jgi:hypothetical protein
MLVWWRIRVGRMVGGWGGIPIGTQTAERARPGYFSGRTRLTEAGMGYRFQE